MLHKLGTYQNAFGPTALARAAAGFNQNSFKIPYFARALANSPYPPESSRNSFKLEVVPLQCEPVVEKRTNNAFIGTDLMQVLGEYGSTELAICGVLLENSVENTVRMAGNPGFLVYLAADATASTGRTDINGKKWSADDVHALTLGILNGEYAKVVRCSDLIFETDASTLQ